MKKLHPFYFFGCLSLLALLSFNEPLQENMLVKNILGKLLLYSNSERPEKAYLQTDKDFYTNGETIWFKTYLVDGIDHTSSDKSKVVYVELVNTKGEVVKRRKQFILDLGSEGEIQLDQKMEQGEYTLRAYTKYMLNENEPVIFEKKIPIWFQSMSKSDAPEVPENMNRSLERDDSPKEISKTIVRFFPEGGQLISGMSSKLGIEVNDGTGNGLAVQGTIMDLDGNVAASFQSGEFGLGTVNFKPLPGKTYHAKLDTGELQQKFELPTVYDKGYKISVNELKEYVLVQTATNIPDGLQGALVLGHLRGEVFLKQVINGYGQMDHAVKIYPDQLKEGVAQFTLFTPKGEPVCERLFFINNPKQRASLTIKSDRKSYGTRNKVELGLEVADAWGKPLEGEFSMSVVSNEGMANRYQDDIRSWLLLNSDVGATVPDAGYFFEGDSPEKKQLLDALMLTHGWRRFQWSQLLEQKTSKKLRFQPEKGITVNGRTVSFYDNKKPKQSLASLTLMGEDLIYSKDSTDINGNFHFGDFYFQDSLEALVQAQSITEKPRSLGFILDPTYPENLPSPRKKSSVQTHFFVPNNEYLLNAYKKKVADFRFDPREVTQLDEVVVTEKKKSRTQIINDAYDAHISSSIFSGRVFRDSIPGSSSLSAMDLLARIPGVWVTGTYPSQRVSLPGGPKSLGSGTAVGVRVDGNWSDITYLQTLRAIEVSFIDVTWGSDATIFGVHGSNGVVSVYTNRGIIIDDDNGPVKSPGITKFYIPGFNKVREFYVPNYSVDKKEHEKPDYRSTLYWEPNIILHKHKATKIDFFTGDNSGKYLIKVEGLTDDGVPVSNTMEIEVDASN